MRVKPREIRSGNPVQLELVAASATPASADSARAVGGRVFVSTVHGSRR